MWIMFACWSEVWSYVVSGMFSHGSINADSQSISIHGAQTAGKVTVFIMVVASFYSGPA